MSEEKVKIPLNACSCLKDPNPKVLRKMHGDD